MADSINEHTLKLANYLLEAGGRRNLVSISGILSYLTLSLINTGLHGPEKDQMLGLLNSDNSLEEFACPTFEMLLSCISTYGWTEFSRIAVSKTAIFHSSNLTDDFKQKAIGSFGIELIGIDANSEMFQRYIIDKWKRSLPNIPFLDSSFKPFQDELKLLFMNQYYLSFQWRLPFNKRYTKIGSFTDIYNSVVNVHLMRIVNILRYYKDEQLNATIVFLQLKDTEIRAVVVLPDADTNIKYILKRMKSEKIKQWFEHSDTIRIALYLPRFRIIQKVSLKSFFKFYQLSGLFMNNGADLSQIINGGGYINDYIQISGIKIDEHGSYALEKPYQPILYRVSNLTMPIEITRPFIFYLYSWEKNLVVHFSVITEIFS
ncbi:Serpin I2 [Thelohanellus kitauei]|uniref:Serpin I2 n=1 Tax=Thelohanellus kitauei TaxID=669202 RepID=A0A0C2MBG8_THEKT|nr:Serpin I2 [Thelohanellus kitauei]